MDKKFKYRQLMIDKGVKTPCPFGNCQEKNLEKAFHFGFDPVGNAQNFLPGHKRRRQRFNSKDDKKNCRYCGLSMFKSEQGARDKWDELGELGHQKNLKYTHLLIGKFDKDMGVMSIEKGEHFTFFEYEGVKLTESFKVFDIL